MWGIKKVEVHKKKLMLPSKNEFSEIQHLKGL